MDNVSCYDCKYYEYESQGYLDRPPKDRCWAPDNISSETTYNGKLLFRNVPCALNGTCMCVLYRSGMNRVRRANFFAGVCFFLFCVFVVGTVAWMFIDK